MNTAPKSGDVDALNQLLRGELSAVETYDQAIEKFDGKHGASELKTIRDEHSRAVRTIKEQVAKFGGEPSSSSGIWGTFVTTVTGTAKVMGPETVLAALKKGEEHGIGEYEKAIANSSVNHESKELFRSEFLPRCRQHIAKLDDLVGSKV